MVVDIYRTPIERKMSEYFENVHTFHFNTTEEKLEENSLLFRFNCLFSHLGTENYFVDKFQLPRDFDHEKKYYLHSTRDGRLQFLKLRLQDFSEWGTILSSLLDVEMFLIRDNVAEEKRIDTIRGKLYKEFKKNYKIPSHLLEAITSTDKDFLSYLSQEEQTRYLQKWQAKSTLLVVDACFTPEEYAFYKRISSENQTMFVIDNNHYLDFGCICRFCMRKRNMVKEEIRKGNKNIPLIYHDQIVEENKMRRIEHMIQVFKKAKAKRGGYAKGNTNINTMNKNQNNRITKPKKDFQRFLTTTIFTDSKK